MPTPRPIAALALTAAAGLVLPRASADEIRVADRQQLNAALAAAAPGTTILVAPGTYAGGVSASRLRGDADRPIVIAAADPADPPVFAGGGSALQLSAAEHIEIRGLVFTKATGNGLNIDDGGSTDTPARHIVIRDVTVRDIGPDGNCDGIKLSGLEDFQLIGCRVERWGRGGSAIDMVGCRRGVIEGCRLLGPGGQQANGVQTKGGTSDVTIRQCHIENAGGRGLNIGGSTGLPYFRPRDARYEARNITVEDCTIVGGEAAIAFVGVDQATVRHNTIYRPQNWVVRILQETTGERFAPCRNGVFEKNLVLFRSDEVRTVFNIGANTQPESFRFTGNHWSCTDRPDATSRLVNAPTAEQGAQYAPPPELANAEKGDLRIVDRQPDQAGARPPEAGATP